jgi:prophage regulatory protein
MNQEYEPPRPRQILRLPAVMARTGMGRSWIYREVAAHRFVRPVKIGRATGWDAAAIDEWVRGRLEQAGADA